MNHLARVSLGSLLLLIGGCRPVDVPQGRPTSSTILTLGLGGLDGAGEQLGVRQIVRNQSVEPLVKYDESGRPIPFLAERWALSEDGRNLTIQLRPATFHDGSPVTAADVAQVLSTTLPQIFGPLYEDVSSIDARSERELVVTFKRRSAFAIEGLDIQVTKTGDPTIGTGPFQRDLQTGDRVEMIANNNYYLGKPAVDRLVLKPYPSVRAAWADLLRGQVDMLYEVGVDAIDSLEPSSRVKLYSFRRHYVTVALFNMRRPALKDSGLRRALNAAVDRDSLVLDALGGLGRPAFGPVWPDHWALNSQAAQFAYQPHRVDQGKSHVPLRCIFPSAISERLALVLQRQLQSVGVDLVLESLPLDEFSKRISSADYDILLTEVIAGPSLIRPYLFWHSKGPYNYGGFNSPEVDAALDSIRRAENDDGYRAGVNRFQQAIAIDPPAIFLTWSERARAVSTAFEVPVEASGRDILSSIHLWRPAGKPTTAAVN